jgi:2-polyprenyl-3-methyl-5-hydroxy-6-metoxy-1,4-benzoquinol methylase
LAQAAGLNERYVREWLEQQASSAILDLEAAGTDPAPRRYSLPPGHDEALVDDASLSCIAAGRRLRSADRCGARRLPDRRRSPYADYGTDLHEGEARFTRPMFDQLQTCEWLPAVPGVHGRLLADPPARVADVACGEGRSSMAIARGYPKVRVDGIDMDAASIEAALRHLAGSGLEERVEFHLRDAAEEALAGNYDLVYIH